MTITERTLKKWRREALQTSKSFNGNLTVVSNMVVECQERILRMTQVLLDQHLLNKEVR